MSPKHLTYRDSRSGTLIKKPGVISPLDIIEHFVKQNITRDQAQLQEEVWRQVEELATVLRELPRQIAIKIQDREALTWSLFQQYFWDVRREADGQAQ